MPHNDIPLVDVISLSKLLCTQPISGDLKYTYKNNFVGRKIAGYSTEDRDICLLAPQASFMLCQAQNRLLAEYGLSLLIVDAYRPLKAVHDFVKWFEEPATPYELERKAIHYPHLNKNQLADAGYIASSVSNHCYGQSVDVILIDSKTLEALPMGTCFDYFGHLSHASTSEDEIGSVAYQNRKILFHAMHAANFNVHPKEYWHFDFSVRENSEPLDIDIVNDLQGIGLNLIQEFHQV